MKGRMSTGDGEHEALCDDLGDVGVGVECCAVWGMWRAMTGHNSSPAV